MSLSAVDFVEDGESFRCFPVALNFEVFGEEFFDSFAYVFFVHGCCKMRMVKNRCFFCVVGAFMCFFLKRCRCGLIM